MTAKRTPISLRQRALRLSAFCMCTLLALPSMASAQQRLGTYTSLPISDGAFIVENGGRIRDAAGRARPDVRYVMHAGGMRVFLRSTGFSLVQAVSEPDAAAMHDHTQDSRPDDASRAMAQARPPRYERIDMEFVGGNPQPQMRSEDDAGWTVRFITSFDEDAPPLRPWRRVVYENVWPGIDVVVSVAPVGMKYDLVVRPGGDIQDIQIRYSDNVRPALRPGGGCEVRGELGMLREEAPRCFVEEGGGKEPVEGRFVIEDRTVRFAVAAEALAQQARGGTLVIDPSLSWSTYIGSSSTEYAGGVDVITGGDAFMCGSTNGTNFPATAGVFQPAASAANWDGFIIRFNSAGARIWGTYFAGADILSGLICDAVGNSYMTGATSSTLFAASPSAFQGTKNSGYDAILVKMLANGQRGWATFLGGGANDVGMGVALDVNGGLFITGQTYSTNFPVTAGCYQNAFGGLSDAFIGKFDTTGGRTWCTYFGSSTTQFGHGCITDYFGNVYVIGETGSGMATTPGVLQATWPGGSYSAFVTKWSPAGALTWSTYFGTSATGYDICLIAGDPLITGVTNGIIPGTTGGFQPAKSGGEDAFLARLDATAASTIWATYFGGVGGDHATSIRQVNNRLYMTGCTPSPNFPVTPGAYQTTYGGVQDRFLAQFNELGQRCWVTFIGGPNQELCWNAPPIGERPEHSIAVTAAGDIYGVGDTPSPFPTTPGSFSPLPNGGAETFLARFQADCAGLVQADAGPDANICANGQYLIPATAAGSPCGGTISYSWSPATGLSATNILQPIASPTSTTTYILTVTDQNNCIGRDTVTITISSVSATISPTNATICGTASALLSANTGAGYTYTWFRNGTVIPGANASTYTATQSGSYRVRVQAPTGCADTSGVATVSIGPGPGANITASGPTSFCVGGSVVLNANTGAGLTYVWQRNSAVITGATGSSYTATLAGTYSVIVTNATGCADTANIVVTVNPRPGATITAGGPLTFCDGGSVLLSANTGTGLLYQWRKDGSNIGGANASTYRATQAGSYRVIVTNASGCADTSAAVVVNVNPRPGATVTAAGPVAFCQGGSVVLNANTGAGLTYVWQRDLNTIGGATSSSYTASMAGSYRVIVTNSFGCADTSASIVVTIYPKPMAGILTGGSTVFCDPGSVLLTGDPASGVTYVWLRNGAVIPGATSQTYNATQAGDYRVIVTTVNGCVDTSAITTVTITPPPDATIIATGPTTFCQGGSVTFLATTGAGYTYSWLLNGAAIPGATGSSYAATQTGTYRVIVMNGPGCADTSTAITVTVNPKPAASVTAGGPLTFCVPGSVLLTAMPATGVTYAWMRNSALIPGATSQTYLATLSGDYRAIVTNAAGCSDTSAVITVTAQPRPGASVTALGPTTFCQGSNVQLSANTGSGLLYAWQRDGSTIAGASGPTYTATQSGQYRVIVSTSAGCADTSASIAVTVNPRPVAGVTAGGPTTFCIPGSVLLTATPSTGVTYAWLFIGAPVAGANGPTLVASQSGPYRVIVTNTFGCSDTSAAINVTATPRPMATLTGMPAAICEGRSSTLTANSGPGYVYTWRRNDVTIGGAAGPTYVATQAGSYTVIITGPGGCSDTSDVFVLNVWPRPRVTATAAGPTAFCEPESVLLNATAPAGVTYAWMRDGGAIPGANASSYLATRTGQYRVVVTDANGCSDSSAVITVTAYPRAGATIDPPGPLTLCEGSAIVLSSPTGPAFRYEWQYEGTTITGATSNTYTARQPGTYRVIVTTGNGCIDTSDAVVLTVGQKPDQRIEGKTSVCPNTLASYFISNGAGYSFNWTVVNGTINAGQGTPRIDVLWGVSGLGEVRVTITNTMSGCTRDTTLEVLITTSLRPTIKTSGWGNLCEGDSVTLDAGAGYASYSWLRDGVVLGLRTRTITVTTPGLYSVEVTEASGCSGTSDPIVVAINEKPKVVLYADGSASMCAGQRVTLRAGSNPVGTHKWYRDGKEILGATGDSYTTSQPGVYRVVATSSAGCVGRSDSVTVTVNPSPRAVAIAQGPTSLCEGQSVTLKAQPETGMNYVWLKNYGIIPGATLATLTVSQSGLYSVITTDKVTGCADTSDVVEVIVSPLPLARILGPATFCMGSSITLTADGTTGMVRWSSGESSRSITVTQPGLYELIVTDPSGCEAHATQLVTAWPKPALYIQGSRSICVGGQTTLDARAGFASYRWSTGETTQRITVRTPGLYAATVTDSNGCMASDTAVVIESDRLQPTISGRTTLCVAGTTIVEADSNETYVSFAWVNSADTNIVLATTRRFTINAPGRYRVRVADQGGCEGTAEVEVRMASATPRIAGKMIVCDGAPDTLTAGAEFTAWSWSTGERTRSIIVTMPGTYTVDVTDSAGCVWTASTVVTRRIVTPRITGSKSFCTGSATRLTADWPSAASWLWSTGETTKEITIRNSGNIWLRVTDSSGCQGMVIDTVTESSTLTPSIGGARSFCAGSGTMLDGGADLLWYRWSGLDTTAVLSTARTFEVRTTGTYVLRIADSSGCQGIDTIDVTQYPGGLATITGDTQICTGGTATLDATTGMASYAWSTGETSSSITVTQPGWYTLVVIDPNGCRDTLRVEVRAVTDLVVSITGQSAFCEGTSGMLDAGAGFVQYRWSTGDTTVIIGTSRTLAVTAPGTYIVRVVSPAGCSGRGSITATVWPRPAPVITQRGDTLETGAAATHQWIRDGADIPGATQRTHIALQPGRYTVRVTDANGCEGTAAAVDIARGLGTTDISILCIPERVHPVGTIVEIPISLDRITGAPDGTADAFTAVLSTNPAVAYPLSGSALVRSGTRMNFEVQGRRASAMTTGTLMTLPFEVLWGDTACAVIRIDSLRWADGTAVALGASECTICAALCYEGGARLFRSDGQLALTVRPNPFNASTVIEFEVIEAGMTDITIHDVMGRRVSTLLHEDVVPGRYVVRYDASTLASGTYLCVMRTPSQIRTSRLEVLK